jgi:glycerophosphoryl diester phosphodiesterase
MPLPLVIAARFCGARLIMVNHHACSRMLVRFAHRLDIEVAAWTVNRPADIERVIGFGVDAIISNRPDLVREALAH